VASLVDSLVAVSLVLSMPLALASLVDELAVELDLVCHCPILHSVQRPHLVPINDAMKPQFAPKQSSHHSTGYLPNSHNNQHSNMLPIYMYSHPLSSLSCNKFPDQMHPDMYSSHPRTQSMQCLLPHLLCNT